MVWEEAKRYGLGKKKANLYEERLRDIAERKKVLAGYSDVIKSEDLPWDNSRQGLLKHLANEKLPSRMASIDAYIQEIPPGSKSGKHRHMAEEVLFVLEGRGYDLHWDVDVEVRDRYYWVVDKKPKRFEWEEGDAVYIPPNTIHQHFNADTWNRARFVSITNRLYKYLGWDDLEQIEGAPSFKKNRQG